MKLKRFQENVDCVKARVTFFFFHFIEDLVRLELYVLDLVLFYA